MNYTKILLKLSGEALKHPQGDIISPSSLTHYAEEIIKVYQRGINICVVLGGGNIYRGVQSPSIFVDRIDGDCMGMLATMINSIALYNTFIKHGIATRLMTQIGIQNMYEPYSRAKALAYLKKKYVVIIGGGLGKPCFTTDSAASLYAIELGVDVLVKGTQVDGVYSADPKKNKEAKLYNHIRMEKVLDKKLQVMDMTALTLCREANLPIIVYNGTQKGKLVKVLDSPSLGTFVQPE